MQFFSSNPCGPQSEAHGAGRCFNSALGWDVMPLVWGEVLASSPILQASNSQGGRSVRSLAGKNTRAPQTTTMLQRRPRVPWVRGLSLACSRRSGLRQEGGGRGVRFGCGARHQGGQRAALLSNGSCCVAVPPQGLRAILFACVVSGWTCV